MFSHFFIERPIFASVLSILITLAGSIAVVNLPVAQYPQITPPSIMVACNYPGADARVIADSVAAPIEQQVNGVEDMMYMVSQSNNDGSYTLTVTFKPGVNLNFAQVLVQNRINLALPLLPDVVKQAGVTTRKRNPDILMVVGIYSPKKTYDQVYLSNFCTINIKDEIARVEGVGDCQQFGQQDYSMRIWIDPEKLSSLNMTAMDVVNAIREQNQQMAAGHFGQAPSASRETLELTITTVGRLRNPEEFDNIVIRTDGDGRQIRIRDIGHSTLSAKNLDSTSKLDGSPNASLAIFSLPDANAIATAQRVRNRMKELKQSFPDDVDFQVALDLTPFIRESINEVIRTLLEAIVLVAIVVLVFLQNWRSAVIPLLAVPVAIIGTFAVMAVIGFSLNNLTLFGLVLAIGIVVDDAIVVVEAVEHHISKGMTPRQAAHKAMDEVSGPVIAVALVLSAVFIPCAFITGITGQFFRQFALTIAVSTIISAFNSLTLSPALAAILLQKHGEKKDLLGRMLDLILGWFFTIFNYLFRLVTLTYTQIVGLTLRASFIILFIYAGLLILTWYVSTSLPTGYIPNQDQGRFYIAVQLPDAASLERTQKVINRIIEIVREMDGIVHTTGIAGQSFTLNANGSNFGNFFVTLDSFDRRRDPSMTSTAITNRVREKLTQEIPGAMVSLFTPPPISGLGSASGFKIIIEDRNSLGLKELQKQVDRMIAAGNFGHFKLTGKSLETLQETDKKIPEEVLNRLSDLQDKDFLTKEFFDSALDEVCKKAGIQDVSQKKTIQETITKAAVNTKIVGKLFSVFRANTPQLYVDLNREQCETMKVKTGDVFNTLQIYLGSFYVNDINRFGRTWQVIVQANGIFRDDPQKIKLLKVRNTDGDMVPLGSVLKINEIGGPINIGRYNMYPAAAILGSTEENISSGQGIEEMERLAAEVLPPGMSFEWTEINYMQIDASKNIWNKLIFPLAVVFVFLVLAAQYESWTLPLAVILVVPMCILGSLTGVYLTKDDINIFTQVGFVVLVGLASKNAILIVEYAKHKHEEGGLPRREATLEACKLRLRPILMTSFAFILGVVPLLITQGAGAEMRRTLGTAVFSGMLGVTLFGIFLTPVFFYVIEGFSETPLFSGRRALSVSRFLYWTLVGATLGLFLVPGVLGRLVSRRGWKEKRPVPQKRYPPSQPTDQIQGSRPPSRDSLVPTNGDTIADSNHSISSHPASGMSGSDGNGRHGLTGTNGAGDHPNHLVRK